MKFSTLFILLLASIQIFSQDSDFFKDANSFFHKYVSSGKVNYEKLIRNRHEIDTLVEKIAEYRLKPDTPKNVRKAFLVNAYNLLVIRNVVDNYPLQNPLKVKGFFKEITFDVGGKNVTLDNLEHEMLFPIDKDPRLHFVLVCAAKSCPILLSEAYTPDHLEQQIAEKTKSTLNDSKYVRYENGELMLSELFKWYKNHFGSGNEDMITFINKYRDEKIPITSDISWLRYDWSLNELK